MDLLLFIETAMFQATREAFLADEEFALLQQFLQQHPTAGPIVPNSGGVRKLRWRGSGRGKRGGIRVIYYFAARHEQIWLLTVYAKNSQGNIPGHVLRRLKDAFEAARGDE